LKRILVVSDSHGQTTHLQALIFSLRDRYDIIIHLGDRVLDMLNVDTFKKEVILLRGNMELLTPQVKQVSEVERVIEIEELKVFATHSHTYHTHYTLSFLKSAAKKYEASLVLFGHTHHQENFSEDGIVYVNPGAFKDGHYGIIELSLRKIDKIELFN